MTLMTCTATLRLRAEGTDSEKREFTGLAVPYGEEIERFDFWDGTDREVFAPGAVTEAEGAKIFWRHQEVIGRVTSHRQTPEGWEITGHISATSLGRDAYELLKDGAVNQLSIGFEPIEYTVREDDGVKEWTSVRAREVSLVPNPAYETALISDVRDNTPPKEKTPMDPEKITTLIREQLEPITGDMTDLRSALAQLATPHAPGLAVPYRSFGEYVRAVSSGDEAAIEFHRNAGDVLTRATEGSTTGDSILLPQWMGDTIKLVEERRKTINSFSTAPLPAQGNTLEYGVLDSNSITVDEQENEADDLAFGKIAFDVDNAKVGTYGGYTEVSRQFIERSSVSVLDFVFRAFAIAYARATEFAVRKTVSDHLAATVATSPLVLPTDADVFDYLDVVVDSADLFEERGYDLAGIKVSKDVFKQLVRLTDASGDPIFSVYGTGINRVGELNLKGISGNLANVSVEILPGAATGTIAPYDPVALTTWESPGAPFQLQDENIVNLTKQYSVYGYLSSAVQHPGALVPVRRTGAPEPAPEG